MLRGFPTSPARVFTCSPHVRAFTLSRVLTSSVPPLPRSCVCWSLLLWSCSSFAAVFMEPSCSFSLHQPVLGLALSSGTLAPVTFVARSHPLLLSVLVQTALFTSSAASGRCSRISPLRGLPTPHCCSPILDGDSANDATVGVSFALRRKRILTSKTTTNSTCSKVAAKKGRRHRTMRNLKNTQALATHVAQLEHAETRHSSHFTCSRRLGSSHFFRAFSMLLHKQPLDFPCVSPRCKPHLVSGFRSAARCSDRSNLFRWPLPLSKSTRSWPSCFALIF